MLNRRQIVLRAAVTAAVAALGFALNSWFVESLVRAWPGRAVTLPVAVLFGPVFGGLAAAVSAWPATHSHPGMLALFVVEAVLLGITTARLRTPLAARLLVALMLASSVLLFPGIHGLDSLTWRTAPVAFERVLVLLVAPVLSDLVVAAVGRLWPTLSPAAGPRPLRALIRHAFVLAAVLPILIVSAVSGEFFSARRHEEAGARLNDNALSLADRVNSYVDAHVSGVAALAAGIEMTAPVTRHQTLLTRTAQVYPEFSAVAIAEANGDIRAIHPASFARPGLTLAGQPFLDEALKTRRVAFSDVTPSPVTGKLLVFLGAVVVDADDRVAGIAHGSLRLTAFQHFVESYLTLADSTVVMLDGSNRVIYTSPGLGYREGDDLSQSVMVRAAAITGTTMDPAYVYDPDGDGERTVQLAARAVMPTTGWTVYVQQPEVAIASDVPVYFLITLALVLAALLGSAVSARLFAATVTAPLEELVGFMRHLSLGTAEALPLPAQAPAEIVALTRDVNGMQRRLRESYARLERALSDGEEANRSLEQLTEMLEEKVEQRTAELTTTTQFLENVLAAMPGALFVSDGQGQIHLCNEAASTLVGRPVSELTGSALGTVFAWQHVDDAESPIVRGEGTLMTASGERVPVLLSSAHLATRGGAARAGAIHIAIDIRDRKQLEMELHQSQKLESVGRLAAGVAHEINTPAQFVSDSVQFLKDGLRDLLSLVARYRDLHRAVLTGGPAIEEAAKVSAAERDADLEYLIEHVPGAIDRSIDGLGRVTAIVRSMKDFAHPDRKEMVAVDLNHGIRSTLIIAKNEYKYVADIEAHYGQLPPVLCHGGDINQVVLNIIVNAAHAIGDVVAGTNYRGRIGIETCHEGDWAVIRISDTGGGIPEAIRGRVFDPFFTTKGVGQGTGQGLAIARTIVADRHHGQVSFETEPGHGTTFTIKLPIGGPRSEAAA
jgi:signal transduction histidine kinase/HAMP domain-containing protein